MLSDAETATAGWEASVTATAAADPAGAAPAAVMLLPPPTAAAAAAAARVGATTRPTGAGLGPAKLHSPTRLLQCGHDSATEALLIRFTGGGGCWATPPSRAFFFFPHCCPVPCFTPRCRRLYCAATTCCTAPPPPAVGEEPEGPSAEASLITCTVHVGAGGGGGGGVISLCARCTWERDEPMCNYTPVCWQYISQASSRQYPVLRVNDRPHFQSASPTLPHLDVPAQQCQQARALLVVQPGGRAAGHDGIHGAAECGGVG